MVRRRFWLDLLEGAWGERSVVWLAGVRRVGKTYLCQSLPDTEYFDCELPRIRRTNLRAFRRQYPEGDSVVVARDVARAYSRGYGDLRVRFENLASFAGSLGA